MKLLLTKTRIKVNWTPKCSPTNSSSIVFFFFFRFPSHTFSIYQPLKALWERQLLLVNWKPKSLLVAFIDQKMSKKNLVQKLILIKTAHSVFNLFFFLHSSFKFSTIGAWRGKISFINEGIRSIFEALIDQKFVKEYWHTLHNNNLSRYSPTRNL